MRTPSVAIAGRRRTGAGVQLDAVDGPRWRLGVTSTGTDVGLVTSWCGDDESAAVELPDWVDDASMPFQ